MIKFVTENKGSFNPELFSFISEDLIKALDHRPTQLADVGFVYNYQNDAFRTAQELNLFHFSAAKDLAEIQRLNELFRQSKSFGEFYKLAVAEMEVFNKQWQQTEWQTAALIAASAENYNRLQGKVKLFPYWEYKTVGDDKVRPEHQQLDGIILPANDPRWEKIFPPNGWNCRCYIVPRLASEVNDIDFAEMRARVDAYFETPEWSSADAQGFGINRALLPELFNENQMYIEHFPAQAGTLLKDVLPDTYDLKPMGDYRNLAVSDLPLYAGTAVDFFEKLVSEDGKIFFKDFKSRAVLFDDTAWLKNPEAAKYAERTALLTSAGEALKTPDEVWINSAGKGYNQYVFVRHYQDETLAVLAEVKAGTVYRIKSWQILKDNSAKKLRRGLLIKKP